MTTTSTIRAARAETIRVGDEITRAPGHRLYGLPARVESVRLASGGRVFVLLAGCGERVFGTGERIEYSR